MALPSRLFLSRPNVQSSSPTSVVVCFHPASPSSAVAVLFLTPVDIRHLAESACGSKCCCCLPNSSPMFRQCAVHLVLTTLALIALPLNCALTYHALPTLGFGKAECRGQTWASGSCDQTCMNDTFPGGARAHTHTHTHTHTLINIKTRSRTADKSRTCSTASPWKDTCIRQLAFASVCLRCAGSKHHCAPSTRPQS